MKTKHALQLVKGGAVLLLLAILNLPLSTLFAQPAFMSYQGRLFDGGNPANGNYDFTFAFYTGPTGGSPVFGPVTNLNVVVSNGLFTTYINVTGINPSYFASGLARALEVDARTNGSSGGFVALAPRQPVMTAPAAFYAATAASAGTAVTATTANGVAPNAVTAGGIATNQVVKSLNGLEDAVTLSAGANVTITPSGNSLIVASTSGGGGTNAWFLTGNAGTTPGLNYVGTPDDRPLELHVHSQRALLLQPDNTGHGSPNVIGGSPNNSVSGAIGATIGGGGASAASTANSVTAGYGTIGGGQGNTVSGGVGNSVGGGYNNTVNGTYAVVGGGFNNGASGYEATVGGGDNNHATASSSAVSGGEFNTASANGAFVGGGGFDGNATAGNQAAGNASVVGGGMANLAGADYSIVGGGQSNRTSGQLSFVGGGQSNNAAGFYSAVGGGQTNSAAGQNSVVGGGANNIAGASLAVVGGGLGNSVANGLGGTIGGGVLNTVNGYASTVPGGSNNTASGAASFAAGYSAIAYDNNSFVWADGSLPNGFRSQGPRTFNVLASGGVYFWNSLDPTVVISSSGYLGIGTSAPSKPLDVLSAGWAECTIESSNERAILSLHSRLPNGDHTWTLESGVSGTPGLFGIYDRNANQQRMTIDTSGNVFFNGFVGIGTPTPSQLLEVHGSGQTEATVRSIDERAILSLHSTVLGNDQVWTLESGVSGTPGLFGIFDRTAFQQRMTIDTGGVASFYGPKVSVCTLEIRGGCDLAEPFQISAPSEQGISEGSVVVIDEHNPGHLKSSDQPYDTHVAGVVSGANGVSPGIQMQQKGLLEGGKNVALTGRVYALADTSNGPIRPGDSLTTSTIPGHAMRVADHARAQGAILGKAMTGLEKGEGMVLLLVTLQ